MVNILIMTLLEPKKKSQLDNLLIIKLDIHECKFKMFE